MAGQNFASVYLWRSRIHHFELFRQLDIDSACEVELSSRQTTPFIAKGVKHTVCALQNPPLDHVEHALLPSAWGVLAPSVQSSEQHGCHRRRPGVKRSLLCLPHCHLAVVGKYHKWRVHENQSVAANSIISFLLYPTAVLYYDQCRVS
jgi:hypothetical protein